MPVKQQNTTTKQSSFSYNFSLYPHLQKSIFFDKLHNLRKTANILWLLTRLKNMCITQIRLFYSFNKNICYNSKNRNSLYSFNNKILNNILFRIF